MTYTAEQVFLRSEDVKYSADIDFRLTPACAADICKMLRDYAALLRERESAKAAVTDDVVHEAIEAYVISDKAAGVPRFDAFKVALEAVAPMLANAWVPDNCVLIAVERPEGYEDVHPDLVAEDFAGDALERGWAYQVIAAAPKPETEK